VSVQFPNRKSQPIYGLAFHLSFCHFAPIGISSQVLPSTFRPVFFFTVGSVYEVPIADTGEVKVGWHMKATIFVDHRSAMASSPRSMQALAKYLEEPLRLLV
jgi:hypothetical protein